MAIRITPLDKLFSEYVRRLVYSDGGAKCEYCGKFFPDSVKENGDPYPGWRNLECSHFIGRRKRATRHDPDNACAVCYSCHNYLGEHPYEHTEFFRKRLGSKKLEELIIKGNQITKVSKAKEEVMKEELRNKLKGMETL